MFSWRLHGFRESPGILECAANLHRLKILVWGRDGFLPWWRLEAGVFKLPRMSEGARSVELPPRNRPAALPHTITGESSFLARA